MKKNVKNTVLGSVIVTLALTLLSLGCQKSATEALESVPRPKAEQSTDGLPSAKDTVSFNIWKELLGGYELTQFNGQNVQLRPVQIEESRSHFYDKKSRRYLDSVIFPLFANVQAGSDMSYKVGPMEGFGTSTVTELNGIKIYTYKFDGDINLQGYEVNMQLDLQVTKENNNLYINYYLNMPGHMEAVQKIFTLTKTN
jgi:hypothetical protein